MMILKLFLL